MIDDIETLRQQAALFSGLQQASVKLAELEREQAAELAQQQREEAAAKAQQEFDASLGQFLAAKVMIDQELDLWLERGREIVRHRQRLATTAAALQEMARRLAHAKLSAGIVKSPLGGSDAVKGEAEQILINRTGFSKLMTVNAQPGEAGILLSAICQLTGDAVIKSPKPARISIDTSAGPMVETRF